jgi:hypothetical protein
VANAGASSILVQIIFAVSVVMVSPYFFAISPKLDEGVPHGPPLHNGPIAWESGGPRQPAAFELPYEAQQRDATTHPGPLPSLSRDYGMLAHNYRK